MIFRQKFHPLLLHRLQLGIGEYLLTLLRVDLNQLKYYKFQHNFDDTDDPMCSSNDGIETTVHYLIDCRLLTLPRKTLVSNVSRVIGANLLNFSKQKIVKILLYGDKAFSFETNINILHETDKCIHASERFPSS